MIAAGSNAERLKGGFRRANRRHPVQLGGIEHVLSCKGHVADVGARTGARSTVVARCSYLDDRFFCASVAALTLRALNPYGNGKLVLLEVIYTRDYHSNSIYVVAVILGLMGVSLKIRSSYCEFKADEGYSRGFTAECGLAATSSGPRMCAPRPG